MRLRLLNRQFAEGRRNARLLHQVVVPGLVAGLAGAIPSAAAGQQDCLYVLNQLNNSVAAVRRTSNTVVASLPMPMDDCPQPPCHPMPTALAFSAGATRLYVTRQDVNLAYVLDPVARTVIDTVTIDSGSSPVAASAAAALSPNGASLYVANLAADSVSMIATSSNEVVDTISVGNGPRAVALTPDGTTVFVGNGHGDNVSVIRTADGMVTRTIDVGHSPAGVAVSPNGARAYVSNDSDGSVSVIDVATLTVVDTITVGQRPRAVAFAPGGAAAYVGNVQDGTVSVIDTAAGEVAGAPIAVGTAPVAIAVSSDGASAYVANLSSNTVSAIDTASRAVTTIEQLSAPFDLALGPCPAVSDCAGDCDGNGMVVVSELVTGVNIALGIRPASACPAFDTNGDDQVMVNELVRAVNNALTDCAA